MCVCLCFLYHLLRDLELLYHADLIVHLDAALHQLHLRAVEIRKAELVDLKLLDHWRQFSFLTGEGTEQKQSEIKKERKLTAHSWHRQTDSSANCFLANEVSHS